MPLPQAIVVCAAAVVAEKPFCRSRRDLLVIILIIYHVIQVIILKSAVTPSCAIQPRRGVLGMAAVAARSTIPPAVDENRRGEGRQRHSRRKVYRTGWLCRADPVCPDGLASATRRRRSSCWLTGLAREAMSAKP